MTKKIQQFAGICNCLLDVYQIWVPLSSGYEAGGRFLGNVGKHKLDYMASHDT